MNIMWLRGGGQMGGGADALVAELDWSLPRLAALESLDH
jgi:hypothetical protein